MKRFQPNESLTVGGWHEVRSFFFNRETSWLAFNARVLELAADDTVPLLEKVRFLSIFSSNLDEFFQVRVAGLIRKVKAGVRGRSNDGRTAGEQLKEIRSIVLELSDRQHQIFVGEVLPELANEGIHLLSFDDVGEREQAFLRTHFERKVLPILNPLAVGPGRPFPFISGLSLNLAVLMRNPVDGRRRLVRVELPRGDNRWVRIEGTTCFISQEDLVAAHFDLLFPGMEILEHHIFRVSRSADMDLDTGEDADLLEVVQTELRKRRLGQAVRIEVADSISSEVLDQLMSGFNLTEQALYRVPGFLGLVCLSVIADLPGEKLHWPVWQGVTEPQFVGGTTIRMAGVADRILGRGGSGSSNAPDFFKVLRESDVLVHHSVLFFH